MGLTGKASADKVNWLKFIPPQFSNVAVSLNIGPMLRENTPAKVVDFHLPPNLHAGSL
jgi:hypothetical protein